MIAGRSIDKPVITNMAASIFKIVFIFNYASKRRFNFGTTFDLAKTNTLSSSDN